MRRFLVKLIAIILPVIIVLQCVELKLRNTPNDYIYKHEWMNVNCAKVKILNLGSSHGFAGIKPNLFSKSAFNLAFISQDLKYDKFLYDTYAVQCDSLEYLIFPISYFSLRTNMENSVENWRIKGYHIYMDCDFHRYELFYNLELTSKDKLYSIFDILLHDISFMNCDSLGWGRNYVMEWRINDWQTSGYQASMRHTNYEKEYVIENIQYVQDVINDCLRRDVKVILLTIPTYKSYFELLDTNQLTEMEEVCNMFAEQYENVEYLNYLKHSDFTEEDFYDADHLNEYGAEKLTKMLDEYIMNWQ